MANFLQKKAPPKLRVREFKATCAVDPILGSGLDVLAMPNGHICCAKCSSPYFEVWGDGENQRITIGCMTCGWDTRLLIPADVDLKKFLSTGRFQCFKHKDAGFVIIKNMETLCVGCQYCKTEVRLTMKTKHGIILAH